MRDYRYNIEYRTGQKTAVADHLSRPVRIIRCQLEERWLGKTKEELKQMQREEHKWQEMINYFEGGRIPRSKYPRATIDQFVLEEEILYLAKRSIDNTVKYVLVLPSELRKAALELIHCRESAHLGQKMSILKCEEYFYWPNLKSVVRQFVRECVKCQQYKNSQGLQK